MTESETEMMVADGGGRQSGAGLTMRRGGSTTAIKMVTTSAMVAGALLTAGTAVIHLHLWMTGYRHIATIGPLFLLQAVGGFVLAAVVASWHRWLVAASGALFLLATAGGLVVSTRVGLFGFKDSFGAPYAGMALTLEIVGAAVLAVAAVLLRRGRKATA
jgi:hypothetical protein